MVIPVGERFEQMLYRYTKKDGKLVAEPLRPTLFVPMTGTAEAGREIQPDPLNPKMVNSSFEEEAGNTGEPRGWYYCRQMKLSDAGWQALPHVYERCARPHEPGAAGLCRRWQKDWRN